MLIIDEFVTVGHRHGVDLDAAMIAVVVDHSVDLLLHDVAFADDPIAPADAGSTRLATGDEAPVVG